MHIITAGSSAEKETCDAGNQIQVPASLVMFKHRHDHQYKHRSSFAQPQQVSGELLADLVHLFALAPEQRAFATQVIRQTYLAEFRGAGLLGKCDGPASTLPMSTTPLVLAWLDDHILSLPCASKWIHPRKTRPQKRDETSP